MKQYLLCCCFICACTLLLAACTSQTPAPKTEPEPVPLAEEPGFSEPPAGEPPTPAPAPVFHREALPELTPFVAPREIVSRYGEAEFVDTLKAAADYGRLYPYEGKFVGAKWESMSYYYIDKNGKMAIPGPFWEAESFVDGRANVTVGKSRDQQVYTVIDTKGTNIPYKALLYSGV